MSIGSGVQNLIKRVRGIESQALANPEEGTALAGATQIVLSTLTFTAGQKPKLWLGGVRQHPAGLVFTPPATISWGTALSEDTSWLVEVGPVSDVSLRSALATAAANFGAYLIGLKSTDAGTVPTTLHLWMQRSKRNLKKDYGAVLDGVTSESALLAAAFADIAAYGGGELEFGKTGTLRLTAQCTLPENLTFTGDSRDVCRIKVDGAFVGLARSYATHTDVNRLNLHMRHIGIMGSANAMGGMILTRPDYFDLEHVGFTEFPQGAAYGFTAINAYRSGLRYCHFENIANRGVFFLSDGSFGCNAMWIERSEFIGNNNDNFVGAEVSGQNIEFRGNDFSGSTHAGNGRGIDLIDCEGVLIEQNYIERWGAGAILATSGLGNRRVEINNNVLHALATNICNFNNPGSPNDRITVENNRFPDSTALQKCCFFGTATKVQTRGNDPAAATFSDYFPTDGRTLPALVGSMSYNPPAIPAGGVTTGELIVPGARPGDTALVGLTTATAADVLFSAYVRGNDVVRFAIENREQAAAVDFGPGTLHGTVFRMVP